MSNILTKKIELGKTSLGIELGSTRIKAVLIGDDFSVIAKGSHEWENELVDGIWTYSLKSIHEGLQLAYKKMADSVEEKYGVKLKKIGSIGISAMMHGYMVFDKEDNLLVPFRTWRNTRTKEASEQLSKLFDYPIPQRWSIAHLYQAILDKEPHVSSIDYLTTLEGYIHYMLTGQKVLGVGEVSGMFPVDIETKDYNAKMIEQFDSLVSEHNFDWKLSNILPKCLVAGENAGTLTEQGVKMLDKEGILEVGIPLCPPEGDAGTGMVATNSIAKRTGNVSAGTSVFAMVVLEKELSKVYEEIDLVTTPAGDLVAMVHCNNCTSDINAWVNMFYEFSTMLGSDCSKSELFDKLYFEALKGDKDCGGLLSYNYFSGEHITGCKEGRPLFVRHPNANFTLANFFRTHIYTSLGALNVGLNILFKEEKVRLDNLLAHGGLFIAEDVGQSIMAACANVPVTVMLSEGEGGAFGIALLASYLINKTEDEALEDFLNNRIFNKLESKTLSPNPDDVKGFSDFMQRYIKGLEIEKSAIEVESLNRQSVAPTGSREAPTGI